jgi:hypothetical protein
LKSAFEIPLPLNEEPNLAALGNHDGRTPSFCVGALLDQRTGLSENAKKRQIWL